jgi:hypothetical protein
MAPAMSASTTGIVIALMTSKASQDAAEQIIIPKA